MRIGWRSLALLMGLLSACASDEPARNTDPRRQDYVVQGQRYEVLATAAGYQARGVASWYGQPFHGRPTSSGEVYDMHRLTAAHRTLPIPTYAKVTNLANDRSVVVRVNDRGPFHDDRLIDLSYAAAAQLGILMAGTGRVEVRALPRAQWPEPTAEQTSQRLFLQLGAFAQAANADRLRDAIAAYQLGPVSIEPREAEQGTVYRVRLGPLQSWRLAEQTADKLRAHGLDAPHIVVD